ncbi:uncharacterized protein LOC133564374 isoform X2 [Nerophis ophidion]|uniref:uncharacterized protein LOC133564374 isoform X2 n=1 Tax=Nerophis ophidion TaxID=159077 RepID=UPI002ADF94B4|nr:uncharacterized protein LOC133564374 isoform X2 [Nerophis ophidion]
MWAGAVFEENGTEEEGVVPESWISNGEVLWPNGVNAAKAITEQKNLGKSWRMFKLIKIKTSECDQYNIITTAEVIEDKLESGKRKIRDNFVSGIKQGHFFLKFVIEHIQIHVTLQVYAQAADDNEDSGFEIEHPQKDCSTVCQMVDADLPKPPSKVAPRNSPRSPLPMQYQESSTEHATKSNKGSGKYREEQSSPSRSPMHSQRSRSRSTSRSPRRSFTNGSKESSNRGPGNSTKKGSGNSSSKGYGKDSKVTSRNRYRSLLPRRYGEEYRSPSRSPMHSQRSRGSSISHSSSGESFEGPESSKSSRKSSKGSGESSKISGRFSRQLFMHIHHPRTTQITFQTQKRNFS